MKKQGITDKKIKEYASLNAKNMIERLVELIEYQENVRISYTCKIKEAK